MTHDKSDEERRGMFFTLAVEDEMRVDDIDAALQEAEDSGLPETVHYECPFCQIIDCDCNDYNPDDF